MKEDFYHANKYFCSLTNKALQSSTAIFMTIGENAWQLLLDDDAPDYCFLTMTYLANRYRERLVSNDQNPTPLVEWSLES